MKNLFLIICAFSLSFMGFGQCQADFTTSINGGTATFTNMSTGSNLGYSWYFGDGNSSSLSNPSHTYTSTGLYNVCLTIYSLDSLGNCQQTYCDSIYVVADSTTANCNASANVTSNNGSITGINTSTGGSFYTWEVLEWNWTPIYSTSSTNLNYTPNTPGLYNICIVAYDSLQIICDSVCYNIWVDSTFNTGCDASASFDVNANGTITGTATSSGAYDFYWAVFDSNGTTELYNSSTNPMSYNPGSPGNYLICLTTYDSLQMLCDSTCYTVTTDSTAGLNSLEQITLNAYPNPANDVINVNTSEGNMAVITLINISGAIVREVAVTDEITQIELQNLPQGMYFIHALGREGQQLSSCKIIKR